VSGRWGCLARLGRDERGVIVNFLIKTIIVFALLGLIAYDLGQVVVAQVKAQDTASAAAQAGADAYYSTKNVQMARNAADQAAGTEDPTSRITAFRVNADGSVTVTVERTANTLLVARVPPLRRFGMQQATDQESHAS
jgi:Flp pilus assembly protein TadG